MKTMTKTHKGEAIVCDKCKASVRNGVYTYKEKLYCSKTCVNKAAKEHA